jgi:hypothetical protein
MSNITPLATGQITNSDTIVVVLVEPADPNSVVIHWPDKPTVCDPRRFGETASVIVRLFSEAHIALAAIRAGRQL